MQNNSLRALKTAKKLIILHTLGVQVGLSSQYLASTGSSAVVRTLVGAERSDVVLFRPSTNIEALKPEPYSLNPER